jgi:hypothetical protein
MTLGRGRPLATVRLRGSRRSDVPAGQSPDRGVRTRIPLAERRPRA